jgi:RNA polymerase sigma-70 factor (ECF subfamily)
MTSALAPASSSLSKRRSNVPPAPIAGGTHPAASKEFRMRTNVLTICVPISPGTQEKVGSVPTAPPRRGGSDEVRLVERVSARDPDAFEQLYRLYQPRLHRFLVNLLRCTQLVEEVLDDTMIVVWQSAHRFRGASKVSTWIFAIAYRKALKARTRWSQPIEDEDRDSRTDSGPGPEQQLQRQRLHQSLLAAMNQLSANHRAVIDLTYFHGLGCREIAEIMECPVDTVKTRTFHARRRLRDSLSGAVADWL